MLSGAVTHGINTVVGNHALTVVDQIRPVETRMENDHRTPPSVIDWRSFPYLVYDVSWADFARGHLWADLSDRFLLELHIRHVHVALNEQDADLRGAAIDKAVVTAGMLYDRGLLLPATLPNVHTLHASYLRRYAIESDSSH